jgi:DNA modification methylase
LSAQNRYICNYFARGSKSPFRPIKSLIACIQGRIEGISKGEDAVQIELRKLTDIKPYDKNPRHNDAAVDAVARSIKEFDFRQPIVLDELGIIIVGHTRYKAAIKLGMEEVPVHVAVGLSPEQARAYRIADNATGAIADWNQELLVQELVALQSMDVDLDSLGFSAAELDALIGGETQGQCDPDDIPAPPEEAVTQPGDLWVLGSHKLVCGDSTDPAEIARLMDGEVATMLFGDPPWNVAIGQDSNPRHRQRPGLQNDNLSAGDFRAFLDGFVSAVKPFVKGDYYCVLGASEWPTLDSVLRGHGYHWSATIIWVKDVFVLGRSKYHRRYEPIWFGWHSTCKSSFGDARDLDDVWEVARPKRSEEHPTMKPVELVCRALQNSSRMGDHVIDPFGGSGSTLIAAEQSKRKAHLMELEPRYCDVIVKRWESFTGEKAERIPAAEEAVA